MHTTATTVEAITPEEHALYQVHSRANFRVEDRSRGAVDMLSIRKDEIPFIQPIDNLEHSLQCATRVVRDGGTDEEVVAALLHDCGQYIAHDHGELAALVLAPYATEETLWVLQHHGISQDYHRAYMPPENREARDRYHGHPHFEATARFCALYDQTSFDPVYAPMKLDAFTPYLTRVFSRPVRRVVAESGIR